VLFATRLAGPIRATFSLTYVDAGGNPTSGDKPGAWYCPEHRPPRTRVSSPAPASSPNDALTTIENTIGALLARFEDTLEDNDCDESVIAFVVKRIIDEARPEIERGLKALKASLAARELGKTKARPKPSPHVTIEGQVDIGEIMNAHVEKLAENSE